MTVEIISWSISTKVWDQAGIKLATYWKHYVVGTEKNRLNEMVLFSTHNKMFQLRNYQIRNKIFNFPLLSGEMRLKRTPPPPSTPPLEKLDSTDVKLDTTGVKLDATDVKLDATDVKLDVTKWKIICGCVSGSIIY